MSVYDAVMKGPPRWFTRTIILLVVSTVCIQLGMYVERSQNTAAAIQQRMVQKDREIDLVKEKLLAARAEAIKQKHMLDIIICESSAIHENVWGDGGKSYGIAQFQYATFKELRGKAGRPDLRWSKQDDQLWLLSWALDNGYGSKWTCYEKTRSGDKS
jgi:hypothetical protein